MWIRRFVAIPLIVAIGCATIPAPALAGTSTAQEIAIGKEYDKEIVASNNVVSDPLLNAWVNGISDNLFAATARKDVPYSIKILDVPDVNAFSTMGGFVYIDEGTLDFAQSDDELAGVIGHETGHIERRHALQAENKVSIIDLLMSVGSLFSPFLYRFGQIFEAGMIAKIQRDDEYQADKYGLMLMTRTGYDPDAMVSFMSHLGSAYGSHDDLLDKYLADHPDEPKRVAALVGYPELDPKVRTDPQRLAAAIHDEDEARYAIAARKFAGILKTDPANTIAQYHLGETQIALGDSVKSEQNLTLAAANGSPETHTLADAKIQQLRDGEKQLDLLHVDLQPLRDRFAAAESAQADAVAAIQTRRNSGRDQLKALQDREETITYGMPNFGGPGRPGSHIDTVQRNIATLSRALNMANSKARETLDGVGEAGNHQYGGLLKRNDEILAEMHAQLDTTPSPLALSTLPAYPRMLDELGAADANMVRAIDASRASLAVLDVALGDLDEFIHDLQTVHFRAMDISDYDYHDLEKAMVKTVDSINRAAVDGAQASQLYNMARAQQNEVRLNLLGLASTPARYATLQHALDVRFHNATIDYTTMIHDNLTPADVVSASIVAADTNTTPPAVIAEAAATHRSIVDLANARGMHALSLEIFLGLIYLDYMDDPEKEARSVT